MIACIAVRGRIARPHGCAKLLRLTMKALRGKYSKGIEPFREALGVRRVLASLCYDMWHGTCLLTGMIEEANK